MPRRQHEESGHDPRTQERKDVWEVWAASLADALRMCRERELKEEQTAVRRGARWKTKQEAQPWM